MLDFEELLALQILMSMLVIVATWEAEIERITV
jgi:hypothetical protein